MCNLLYGNASTIATTLGLGNYRHIRIAIQDTLNVTILPNPYNSPMDLGETEQVPVEATTAVLWKLQDKHSEARRIHDNHNNIDAALKTMSLQALDSTYIFALHNVFTVYMGSSTKDIMNHLMTRYGRITAAEIKEKKILQETLDTSQPIDVFFKVIDRGVQSAIKTNTPLSPA